MDARERHLTWSGKCFETVREDSAELLGQGRLSTLDRLVVASLRVRACIELGDGASAAATVDVHASVFRELDVDARWPGDVAGVALLRAAARADPDRAIADLVSAEELVTGDRARAYIDLRKVEALLAKAEKETDASRKARALDAAIAVCDARKSDARFAPLRELALRKR